MSEGMCKPHYINQDFSPLYNAVYFIEIIKQNPLHNGNSPITDPITKIGVAHAFEQYIDFLRISLWVPVFSKICFLTISGACFFPTYLRSEKHS